MPHQAKTIEQKKSQAYSQLPVHFQNTNIERNTSVGMCPQLVLAHHSNNLSDSENKFRRFLQLHNININSGFWNTVPLNIALQITHFDFFKLYGNVDNIEW